MINNMEDFDENKIYTVSEVIRENSGTFDVEGMIISMSKLFKMISKISFYCDKCQKLVEKKFPFPTSTFDRENKKCDICDLVTKNQIEYKHINAVRIELQDIDSFSDIDKLSVILFDDNTKDIKVGETVVITGNMHIEPPKNYNKKISFNFYGDNINYKNRENLQLSENDIDGINKFMNKHCRKKIITELVKLFAVGIIGNEYVKKGIILSAVNTNNSILKKQRINILLVGDPGTAKSELLRHATKLVTNSRYESGQHSSVKSLTAMITKEDDNYVLRIGSTALSGGSFCAINEIGQISYDEQGRLLDILQEGIFSINKYGINATIAAPTTILASANPINSEWKDKDKIDLNEIPVQKPLLDRFDLIFPFRKFRDKEEIKRYVEKKI